MSASTEISASTYRDELDVNLDDVEADEEIPLSVPLQAIRSFGPECYTYDPNSKWMKPPVGKPSDRIVVGLNPGSYENYKIAKERTRLTVRLMKEICESVQIFRPSESLYNLDQLGEMSYECTNADSPGDKENNASGGDDQDCIEIDVVLSGGGLKGYFMSGASFVLLRELKKRNIKIARISGASAGSWAGMFMLTGVTTESWIETYFANQIRPGSHLLEAYRELWPRIKSSIPHDAYLTCTDKLFISITELTWTGFRNRIISKFTSNEDLFDCCCASSTIPYMSAPIMYALFRGVPALDGGLTNNTPVFPDGCRRQLVFRLYEVEYPWRQMLNPTDTCIETLVLRGALLMSRFLQGEPQDCITWLEEKERKEDLPDGPVYSRFLVRGLLLPAVMTGYIFLRGTGISTLAKSFLPQNAVNFVIPFANKSAAFGTSTVRFIGGTLLTGLVEILRNLRVLL